MKLRPVSFSPEAEADLDTAKQYYENVQPGLGIRFVLAVQSRTNSLPRLPYAYPVWRGRKRYFKIEKFPYIVIYLNRRNQIEILSVIPTVGNPQRWQPSH